MRGRCAGRGARYFLILGVDSRTTSAWTVDYTDMAIFCADGTVTPLYNGQQISITPSYGGATSLSASVVSDTFLGRQVHYYLGDHLGTT